jgi:RimJ/RimL family protein N-acetyltransferase
LTLEGSAVRLEPLCQEHAQGLYNRGRTAHDWEFMPRACFVDMADTRQWIEEAVADPGHCAFALVETGKNKAIGSTRYLNIRPQHRSVEIGWTWIGQEWQRTAINTQAKFLLLQHAFERLHCERVEFKTDSRNLRSQAALERLGATREGVLRRHMIVQGGYVRDSVYYSIIAPQWPATAERLQSMLQRT